MCRFVPTGDTPSSKFRGQVRIAGLHKKCTLVHDSTSKISSGKMFANVLPRDVGGGGVVFVWDVFTSVTIEQIHSGQRRWRTLLN